MWELTRNDLQFSDEDRHQAAALPRFVCGPSPSSGSRDPHLHRASVKRRLPYAGRGVRPGQIFVTLATKSKLAARELGKVNWGNIIFYIHYILS